MTASSTLLTAVVAAATAVVVALFTQFVTWRRERTERVYERRRAALLDAQDAALALELRLGEFSRAAERAPGRPPSAALREAEAAISDGLAMLEVRLARVEDASVVQAVTEWRQRASLHAISAEEVRAEVERALWTAMNDRFARALRSATGTGS